MKISFLIGILFFLVLGCNKVETKDVADYNVIETDNFIIKSKYDFIRTYEFYEKVFPKGSSTKDSLKFLIFSGEHNYIQTLMICDEELIYSKNVREVEEKRMESLSVLKPKYTDTIINSNKIEILERKIINKTDFTAKFFKNDKFYFFTLSSDYKYSDYDKDKKAFFEILEGTTIKQ